MKKRILGIFIAAIMVVTLCPVTVFADNKVAQIGDQKYETLQDAIDAVPTKGKTATTIVMLSNTTENVVVDEGKKIKIDFNGKKLSLPADSTSVSVVNYGTLEMVDGTITTLTSNEALNCLNTYGSAILTNMTLDSGRNGIFNCGTETDPAELTLNNCTINAKGVAVYNGEEVYDDDWNVIGIQRGLLTINGGMYSSLGYADDDLGWNAIITFKKEDVTILSAVLKYGPWFNMEDIPYGMMPANVTVTDVKEVENALDPSENDVVITIAPVETVECELTMDGEDPVKYASLANCYERYEALGGKATIKLLKSLSDNLFDYFELPHLYIIDDMDLTFDLNGCTFTTHSNIQISDYEDVEGGTFTLKDSSEAKTGVYEGLNNSGCSVAISDGKFIFESGKLIQNYSSAMIMAMGTGEVEIIDGVMQNTNTSQYSIESCICFSITNDTTSVAIKGGTFLSPLIRKDANIKGNLEISGGYFYSEKPAKGSTPISQIEEKYLAPGCSCIEDTSVEGCNYKVVGPPVEIVRTGKRYSSLQEAINAAQDGDTIKLLRDIELSTPVRLDKEGTYTIDGDGYKLTAAEGANFADDGCLCFGPGGSWDASDIAKKNFTIKNTTFSEFTNVNDVIRAEGCTLTIDKCLFEDNTVTGARSKSVVLLTGVDATITDSEFSENTAGLCIDFNTQGGDPNTLTESNFKVDNCYFNKNTLNGNGVIYAYGPAGNIKNSTFKDNTIDNMSTAVIYMSGTCNVTANAFEGNKTTTGGTKEAVVIIGSSAQNSKVQKNAFISHTFEGTGDHALVNVGATGSNLSSNYWLDGNKYEIGTGKDILDNSKYPTISNYADEYEKNKDNYGVTVHIAPLTVTFDSNGGSAVADKKAEYNGSVEKPKNPTRDGFVFAGWTYKVGEKTGKQFLFDSKITEDTELIAGWVEYTKEGNITVKDTHEGVKAETSIKKSDIPLTPGEIEKIESGSKLDVNLLVKVEEAKKVSDEEKELIIDSMKDNQKLGMYLDCSLLKTLDGTPIGEIKETLNPITIVLTVPENLRANGRVYSIIRVHDDKAEILFNGKADKDWKISFETDKFSTYAIVYEGGIPKTGDLTNIILYLCLGGLALFGIVNLLIELRKRSANKR